MSDMYNQPQDEALSPASEAPVDVLKPPRRVPTSRAGSWIYQGFSVFNCGMGTSVGIMLVALLIQIVGNLLPGANLLLSIFSLVFAAGYLAVAHGAYTQGHLRFGNYFAGFRKNMLPLLWLGVLALMLSMLGVLMLFVGLLVVMPVLAYAGYFSYRDIFLYEDEVISV